MGLRQRSLRNNYIISVRNVGYVRAAGRVVKDAFGSYRVSGRACVDGKSYHSPVEDCRGVEH